MNKTQQREWLSWGSVGLLALLCGALGLLQNRWIGEISRAEKERLHQQLQTQLNQVGRELNADLTAACAGLRPSSQQVEQLGKEAAYSTQYLHWRDAHDRVFSRIAIVIPQDGEFLFLNLDLDTGQFSRGEWPAAWSNMRDQIEAHYRGDNFGPAAPNDPTLIDIPRFGETDDVGPEGGRRREQEWLILELNVGYIRANLLPDLLRRHLYGDGKIEYLAQVIDNGNPPKVVFHSSPDPNPEILREADASVNLLNVDREELMRRAFERGRHRGERGGGFRRNGRGGGPPVNDEPQGQWRLLVRHQAGSIEAVVARARWQNLATSVGILLLILATVAALVRFSRRSQQLAELQMNFVAGVSHELRTPITVIRTAAFNLRGRIAAKPDQVERYGQLIQDESEKLTALVEQVLRFASARAGQVIRAREPLIVEDLIEGALRSSRAALAGAGLVVEKKLDADLPVVLADELAMRHALQNLLDNALKYGVEGSNWIGVFASAVSDAQGEAVEVRVADRGPGIPLDEQEHVFDPFFRGRRAVQDQVHGTGLGLNLVKKIIEAHGGSIRVESEPMKGTAFVLRIPAAPAEIQNEFAHSFS